MNTVPSWQYRQIFDRWYNKNSCCWQATVLSVELLKVCHALKKTAEIGISDLLSVVLVF